MDGIKVNGLAFLTTVSRNLQYCTVQVVKHQTAEVYRNLLGDIFRMYNTGKFKIAVIHCDSEFLPLIDHLAQEFDVSMNFANLQ
jgi:hypothetical protein